VVVWGLVVVLALAGGCTRDRDRARPVANGCDGAVKTEPLPVWARGGFTPPDQAITYVQGASGDIVGVLFGWPLTAPRPPRDRQNKILWVARESDGGDPLRIAARLAGSDVAVVREVEGGPGPSVVDMPTAGCWRFDLTWSGHADRVFVPYRAGVAAEGAGG
jgi:hypothetical protein